MPPTIASQSETILEASPRRETGRTTHGPLEAGAPFGSRYRIPRALGAGGMGVVDQAWDDELGVAVALKVIGPEVTADPHAACEVEPRSKPEPLLARQVTHKNVVRIHDLGEVEGIKYITMTPGVAPEFRPGCAAGPGPARALRPGIFRALWAASS